MYGIERTLTMYSYVLANHFYPTASSTDFRSDANKSLD